MSTAQQTAATVLDWLEEGRRVAAGLLVGIDGSAPLDVGASMYVDADGVIEGSVTGGCVESAVAQEAMAMLAGEAGPRLITYGISDELAGTVGLMCGGTVHIFVHELTAASRDATVRGLGRSSTATQRGRHPARRPPGRGELYVDGSSRVGGLGGPRLLDVNVEREARGLVAHGRTTVRHFGQDGTTLGTGLRVHVTTHADPPQMIIFGRDRLLGRARDHRRRDGLPDHDRRPAQGVPRLGALLGLRRDRSRPGPTTSSTDLRPGPRDAVLVFSHDAKLDVPALMAAFGTAAGLHRRPREPQDHRGPRAAAARGGRDDADLARLHAPCGLDIGAATVEETAIAVLAELIAHRAGRPGVLAAGVERPDPPRARRRPGAVVTRGRAARGEPGRLGAAEPVQEGAHPVDGAAEVVPRRRVGQAQVVGARRPEGRARQDRDAGLLEQPRRERLRVERALGDVRERVEGAARGRGTRPRAAR